MLQIDILQFFKIKIKSLLIKDVFVYKIKKDPVKIPGLFLLYLNLFLF